MEVSLDHFSGHCLWSGRDQSFQNVTSKNDPVWNAANPFKFLSTVSTQRIRFSKSKVQNSIAEGFIAPAPGSPHPTRPRAPHGGCRRQDRTGPKVLLLGGELWTQSAPSTEQQRSAPPAGGRDSADSAAAYLGPGGGRHGARSLLPLRRQRPRLRPGTAAGFVSLSRANRAVLQPRAQQHPRDQFQKPLVEALGLALPVCVSELLRTPPRWGGVWRGK